MHEFSKDMMIENACFFFFNTFIMLDLGHDMVACLGAWEQGLAHSIFCQLLRHHLLGDLIYFFTYNHNS